MRRLYIIVLSLLASSTIGALSPESISLAGRWRFQLDRADVGYSQNWETRELAEIIRVPGDLAEQGIGFPVTPETKWMGGIVDQSWFSAPEYAPYRKPGSVKVPFWLQPELYYAGAAWYQRDIEIPESWTNRLVSLYLERPHWETRVWVDGRLYGTNNSLGTPHIHELGVLPAGKHVLTIRVDNRMVVDVGDNSHSVSDHTQGNWNGIVGRIELCSRPSTWIEQLEVYPDVPGRTFRVVGRIATEESGGTTRVQIQVRRPGSKQAMEGLSVQIPVSWKADGGRFEWAPRTIGTHPLELWDEFAPNRYEITALLESNNSTMTVPLALRQIETDQTRFLINGRHTFFRGTLECAIFPRTGHPPTDVESWRQIIRVAKAHGLNMIRFHSWCPPEAAFVAADELGFYYHVECSSWANQSTTLGDGKAVDAWIYEEADRILRAYGNHPSFLILLYGNEPGGGNYNSYLSKWVAHYKAKDPRRLYSSGAGWPELPENQLHVVPEPRIQAWGQGLKSRINARPPETRTDYRDYTSRRSVPVISHEIGQWCVYPNFNEISKYTGYLKPRNFEIFQDRLNANGLGRLAEKFLWASGKLQTLCYKEDIESALRTPGMGGFQLLDLHDFPGQGTALVGVLDPFWEEKGYVRPAEFSRFSGPTVPLARLEKRVFTTAETLRAEIELAHFGAAPLNEATVEWTLTTREGKPIAAGALPSQAIPIGNGHKLGTIAIDLSAVAAPVQGRVTVRVRGTRIENDWDVWIYPDKPSGQSDDSVFLTSQWDEAAQAKLESGGRVLLTLPPKRVRNFEQNPVKLGFSSIFWNTAWTRRQAPTTLGILCDPRHPALAAFPTDEHSNWQWWYVIHRAAPLRLDDLPRDFAPVVRVIDDWFTARPLGLIIEAKVGSGTLMVCGFDLTDKLDDPVIRQMRLTLLQYMRSSAFKPKTELSPAQVASLCSQPSLNALKGVKSIRADSQEEDSGADLAVDGNPETFWHSTWREAHAPLPHELIVEFDAEREFGGIGVLPRQDGNRNGSIKGYEIRVSNDGSNWSEPLARGEWGEGGDRREARFSQSVRSRWVKLRAISGHANGPWAAVAELTLLP